MTISRTEIMPDTRECHSALAPTGAHDARAPRIVIFITIVLVMAGGLVRPVSAQSEDEAVDEGAGRSPAAVELSPPPEQSSTTSPQVNDERVPFLQFQFQAPVEEVEAREEAGEGDGQSLARPIPVQGSGGDGETAAPFPPVPVPTPDIPAIQAEYRRRYPPLGEPRTRSWPSDRSGAIPASRRLDESVSAPFLPPHPAAPSGALPGPVRVRIPGEREADSRAD